MTTPTVSPAITANPDLAVQHLLQLNRSGWKVRVWDEDEHYLYIDGDDNFGDGFRGRISRYTGHADGEPIYD